MEASDWSESISQVCTVAARIQETEVGKIILGLTRNPLLSGEDVLDGEIVGSIALTKLHPLSGRSANKLFSLYHELISLENFLAIDDL